MGLTWDFVGFFGDVLPASALHDIDRLHTISPSPAREPVPLHHTIDGATYIFRDLKDLLAKATPARSGDELAGIAARSGVERVAAQMTLADLPLATFLNEAVIPYEIDEVTRLIIDTHDRAAFAPIASLTVGGFVEEG